MSVFPAAHVFEHFGGTVWGLFRRCILVGGSMSLEVGFERLKMDAVSSSLSWPCACGPRSELAFLILPPCLLLIAMPVCSTMDS